MKRLFKILISAALTLSVLAGCTAESAPVSMRARWYANPNNEGVTPIDENLVYAVSYEKGGDYSGALTLDAFEGSYAVRLQSSQNAGGEPRFLLTTGLNTSGTYAQGGEEIAFEDNVETTALFMDLKNALRPERATKSYDGYGMSPFGNTLSQRIQRYNYSYLVEYSASKAVVKFDKKENVPAAKDKTYTKINKKYNYFDNEQLLFTIRSLALGKKYSQYFSTVNVLGGELQSVKVAVTDDDPYRVFDLETLGVTENGAAVSSGKKVMAIKTYVSLNSQMSGSTFVCYFAVEREGYENYKARLMRLETFLPDSMGKLVYTLKSVEYSTDA